jgi:hypothetical protein
MRSDIVPGAIFPDYELSDHTGKRRKLSDLQGQHPMVLVLSRGGYCPKDRREAEGLVQLHRELTVAYCRLVTISTDSIVETNEYRSARLRGAIARRNFGIGRNSSTRGISTRSRRRSSGKSSERRRVFSMSWTPVPARVITSRE